MNMSPDHYTAVAKTHDHIVVRMPGCDYGMVSDLARSLRVSLDAAILRSGCLQRSDHAGWAIKRLLRRMPAMRGPGPGDSEPALGYGCMEPEEREMMTDLESEQMDSLKLEIQELEDKVAALELECDELRARLLDLWQWFWCAITGAAVGATINVIVGVLL